MEIRLGIKGEDIEFELSSDPSKSIAESIDIDHRLAKNLKLTWWFPIL